MFIPESRVVNKIKLFHYHEQISYMCIQLVIKILCILYISLCIKSITSMQSIGRGWHPGKFPRGRGRPPQGIDQRGVGSQLMMQGRLELAQLVFDFAFVVFRITKFFLNGLKAGMNIFSMAIRVVEFSNGEYKIRKIFA